jgi:hypothetical protein
LGDSTLADLSSSYATGNVVGENLVGGFAGNIRDGTYYNLSSSGNVVGVVRVGGLVGSKSGPLYSSYSTSDVIGLTYVGGLFGESNSIIFDSYSTGDVSGNFSVGGFVGYSYYFSNIQDSYSTSDVSGNFSVGGFLGINGDSTSSITNSFSVGSVSGLSNVSGFVGENFGQILSSVYYNSSDNPSVAIGFDNESEIVIGVLDLSYFYDSSNSPMSSWNTNIWNFSELTLPYLIWQGDNPYQIYNAFDSTASLFPIHGLFSLLFSFLLLSLFFRI